MTTETSPQDATREEDIAFAKMRLAPKHIDFKVRQEYLSKPGPFVFDPARPMDYIAWFYRDTRSSHTEIADWLIRTVLPAGEWEKEWGPNRARVMADEPFRAWVEEQVLRAMMAVTGEFARWIDACPRPYDAERWQHWLVTAPNLRSGPFGPG